MRERPATVETVIAALSANPAAALGLSSKGRVAAGADADLLLVDPTTGELGDVMCGGRWLLREGVFHPGC